MKPTGTRTTATGRKLSKNQRLVFDFFRTFSRFEYALKEAGCVKRSDEPQVNAEPDWDAFAKNIDGRWDTIVATDEVRAARDYLLQNPPEKQVVRNSELGWAPLVRGGDREARFVLRCVRTIRNNLFHGGKRRKISPERDQPLLRSGLAILNALVELEEKLKYHFHDDL